VVDKTIMKCPIHYVIEADIKGFLDSPSYYTSVNEVWVKSVG